MKLMLYNRSESNLVLAIEPSAVAYEVSPGSKILVEGNFIEASSDLGEIEIGPNNLISLYLEPGFTASENGKTPKRAPGW